mmetsp:Transcript_3137/g.9002  ORF Transcript_3137/g.9002 Transcript_3137/m.9002 type:complete len:585 (-) Transcript_3137:102-1856(-)
MGQSVTLIPPFCEVSRWATLHRDEEVGNDDDPPSPLSLAALTSELCYAASEGDVRRVKSLFQQGVNVNNLDYDRRSALHLAARDGRVEVVQVLLEAGAKVDFKDRWGRTALDEARAEGHSAIAQLLLDAGAVETPGLPVTKAESLSPCQRSPSCASGRSWSPARTAASDAQQAAVLLNSAAAAGNLDAIQELAAKRAELNSADYDGRTPLHIASAHGRREIVEWLATSRANVNQHDSFGLTPLFEAMRLDKQDCVKVLLDFGADDADTEITDVRFCAHYGQWAIPAIEVEMGDVLQRKPHSVLYRATWRGTQVVAKTAGDILPAATPSSVEAAPAKSRDVIREISVLSMLRHPDLVMFLGACFDHPTPFFITEYMSGGDLHSYFNKRQATLGQRYRASAAQIIRWSGSVARALCFLHGCSRPVIHRDLKPQNLLLTRSEDVKVSDFGISKLLAPRAAIVPKGGEDAPRKPVESATQASSWYVAPEVFRQEKYSDRVDVFSFALVMWFMSTGRRPFAEEFGEDIGRLVREYASGAEPRPDLGAKMGRFAPTVKSLIEDCWKADPASRPSAADCAQRLVRASSDRH